VKYGMGVPGKYYARASQRAENTASIGRNSCSFPSHIKFPSLSFASAELADSGLLPGLDS
jgi:hypothetical protein